MKKEDLQKELDELGIKYQENDTNEQLALMLNGHKAIAANKALQEELEKVGKESEKLSTEIGNLNEENHELQEGLEKLKKENKELSELNERLNDQVSLSDASKPTLHLVKVGDKTYRMPAKSMTLSKRVADKLNLESNVVTRETVKKDKKLAKALVEDIKSGFLVEVESKEEKS